MRPAAFFSCRIWRCSGNCSAESGVRARAAERYHLQLIAATTRPFIGADGNWLGCRPSGPPRRSSIALPQLSGHADEVPEIAALVLSHLVERNVKYRPAVFSARSTPCACTAGMVIGSSCWPP